METTTNTSTFEEHDANVIEDEVFIELLRQDQYKRVKGYGVGVTPSQLFGSEFRPIKIRQTEMDNMQNELFEMHAHYETKIANLKDEYEWKMANMKANYE
ncbi:conserved hypothetical protein [Ricinus communis]|uniref:Uncharacterized protein n=1 Tax=Ricinus communis TaxID=3988 RepID=B9SLY5_RICCO|nr:conserved hypothetical protein [Ricinus communis]